jgi:uncharacterized protein (TIGR02246 family)
MRVIKPENWPTIFGEQIAAGDLDAALSLYDPEARFVSPTGEVLAGGPRIREVLAGLVERKAHMVGHVNRVVTTGGVALLYTHWSRTMVGPSGQPVEDQHESIEVLKQQPDGGWKLIVGDPGGRDGEAPRPAP